MEQVPRTRNEGTREQKEFGMGHLCKGYLQGMVTMKSRFPLLIHRAIWVLLTASLTSSCFAVDNPDARDLVMEFEARAKTFEQRIHNVPHDSQSYRDAYSDYETFLDGELNSAYSKLITALGEAERSELRQSQRAWISFRDAEFAFIERNWTRENFGSSYVISRGDYRTTLIKHRVESLYYYLQNY